MLWRLYVWNPTLGPGCSLWQRPRCAKQPRPAPRAQGWVLLDRPLHAPSRHGRPHPHPSGLPSGLSFPAVLRAKETVPAFPVPKCLGNSQRPLKCSIRGFTSSASLSGVIRESGAFPGGSFPTLSCPLLPAGEPECVYFELSSATFPTC